jgi:hypothetical protein
MSKRIAAPKSSSSSRTPAAMRRSQSHVASGIIAQLRAIAASLHLRDRLTIEQRRTLNAESAFVPNAFLEAVATSASVHGGTVAGLPFDANAAREAIARSAAAAGIVQWAHDFAQTVADDALRDRAAVASRAVRAYGMLAKYVETDEGAAMVGELAQMREIMKQSRRPSRRAKAKSAPPATTAPPLPPMTTTHATTANEPPKTEPVAA